MSKTHRSLLKAQNFLLEIGCEDLPADDLPIVWPVHLLKERGIACQAVETYATPRRLVLLVRGVEPIVKRAEKGPPVQVAFDPQGKPTRAAEAFAQRHGLQVSALTRRQTPKGEGVFAEYAVPVTDVLAQAIPEIIRGIPFPRTMRWDETGVRFARPIRWLLALYGSRLVASSFGAVKTTAATRGTRRGPDRPVPVLSAAAYFPTLKRLNVRLEDDQGSKQKVLLGRLEAAARKLGGRLADQTTEEFAWLLHTVTFLAEDPMVQAGSFQTVYLDLPTEVLAASMAKHLKLFSVRAKENEDLLPNFLAVLEGKPERPARVMAHYEHILNARFTDARFFYREDSKTSLESKVPQLAKVTFHERLGTVEERIPRLEKLMHFIADQVRMGGDVLMGISGAAKLAKADLVTQMVREFPSLQGMIGAHYTHHHDGEMWVITQALMEQYRPRAGFDPVPSTPLGAVLSLADRVDMLAGYFGVGLKPTGSMDPYGLRRQANGLVRILVEPPAGVSFIGLSIDTLFEQGIQSWGRRIPADPCRLKAELAAFLRERFEALAVAGRRMDRDLVRAVLAAEGGGLAGAWERLGLLQGWWSQKQGSNRRMLEKAAKVAERTGRIVRSVKEMDLPDSVDGASLREPVERELWDHWTRMAPQVSAELDRRAYEAAVRVYSSLYPVVHLFFEKVFVMDEDLQVRRNRLALMREIHQGLAARFADLSLLPLAGLEPKG